jgi:hypothetical protein
MSKEFIFLIVIAVLTASQIFILRGYFRYINLSNDFAERESKIKKALQTPLFHSAIFNVKNFNNWFKNNKDKNIYAHAGIYLRTDKLSRGHINDYLGVITNGTLCNKDFDELEIMRFEDKIRESWMKQLMAKSK